MSKRKNIVRKFFNKPKKTLIIGVHGLGNKPPKSLLYRWWKQSITEGLNKIEGAPHRFSFRICYWADVMYDKPLNPHIKDHRHPLHIEEPYMPEPIPSPSIGRTPWHYLKLTWEKIKEAIFLSRHGLANYHILFDLVVKASFKDLAAYYRNNENARERMEKESAKKKIRERLQKLLQKHADRKMLIVAHSMGSLIAYDVLSATSTPLDVEVLISIGSPLGLPVLREKMAKDHGIEFSEKRKLPTPPMIKRWLNYSDKEDHFAVFDDLSTYYGPNKDGVLPEDVLVDNDYKDWVTKNAHKSFGYLRTSQLAQVIAEFLGTKRKTLWQKGKSLLSGKKNKKN